MSPKVKTASTILDENETEVVAKPVKNIKEIKEKAKIMEQSIIDEYKDDEIDISPQKYVTVISLTPNQLNLSTQPGGKGKVVTFSEFGQQKRIMYNNLVDIMDSNPGFLERGCYYIAEKRIIRKHGLDELYSTLLTKEVIESMVSISMSDEDMTTLYKSANKTQQGVIVDLIIHKLMADDKSVDMNMVASISKISGIDLLKQVEDNKFYIKNPEA
jgi:hypothetical protein